MYNIKLTIVTIFNQFIGVRYIHIVVQCHFRSNTLLFPLLKDYSALLQRAVCLHVPKLFYLLSLLHRMDVILPFFFFSTQWAYIFALRSS